MQRSLTFLKDKKANKQSSGFTIVELLVVIIVIAILAAIIIIAYTGIKQQAADSKRDADLDSLKKAIVLGRTKTGNTLVEITDNGGTYGGCAYSENNPDWEEPRDLSESHVCWQYYYSAIDDIGDAADIDLSDLKKGDARGNPYVINEGEGEDSGDVCDHDDLGYYDGDGADYEYTVTIPFSLPECL